MSKLTKRTKKFGGKLNPMGQQFTDVHPILRGFHNKQKEVKK